MKLDLELKHRVLDVNGQASAEGSEVAEILFATIYKGDKGDTGSTGPIGPQGAQGPKGNTGQKGDTGSSGVAVSDVAPTDPQVNVWLMPSGIAPEFATKEDLEGKADLEPTTQTVPPAQISPLQGLQTGFNATDGMYRSTAPALLFKGSRTVEALIKLGPNPTANETVFDMRGDAGNIRIDIVPSNKIACLSGGFFNKIQGIEGEYYHIVIRLNSGNNTSTLFINGVLVQTINSNITNPGWFNIGGYGSAGIQKFRGIINNLRTFNYALSDSECLSLWNGGRPNEYMLPGTGSMRDGLIGEFLPCGLLPDKWRDTSGNGNDIAAVGAPLLCYETVPDMAVNTLAVTVTGTAATPVYSFTQSNFAQVSNAVSNGSEPIVKITDSRTTANKPVDLSGVYPAMWNASLNQIENRDLARGFYLNGITPASRPARSSMTQTLIDSGFVFNPELGSYSLGALATGIPEKEAMDIYSYKAISSFIPYRAFLGAKFRATLPLYSLSDINASFKGVFMNTMLQYIYIADVYFYLDTFEFAFHNSRLLKGLYYLDGRPSVLNVSRIITGTIYPVIATVFEDLYLQDLKVPLNISGSPVFSKRSLVYILTNRANVVATPITVTLHPTVFAWASVDSEVQALLEATATQGAVTLVSA